MNGFDLLPKLLAKARVSRVWLLILNRFLGWLIPFNRPHRFRIVELGEDRVRTLAPYRRSNLNHIRGVHACAIATVAEFSSGLMLLCKLNPSRYRLIMAHIEIDYLYQAKTDIVAETVLEGCQVREGILKPLAETGVLRKSLLTTVTDGAGQVVARVTTTWQIKSWNQVRSKV